MIMYEIVGLFIILVVLPFLPVVLCVILSAVILEVIFMSIIVVCNWMKMGVKVLSTAGSKLLG